MKGNYKTIWLLLIAFAIQLPALAADSELIEDMGNLLDQGNFQAAYELGQEGLLDFEGEPEFDFMLALAALETGRPTEAMFALERILQSYPNQQRVKLELARAYFISNNLIPAQQLFNEVLETNPGPNVEANIENFLAMIDARQNALKSSFDWYLSSGIGNDSNINSATELGVIPTSIGNIVLDPNGQGISDNFMDYGGGFTYSYPLSKSHAITASSDYSLHNNISSSDFDLDILAGEIGYVALRGNSRFYHAGRIQRVGLDGELFQTSASALSSWQHNSQNQWSQALTIAYTAVRYDTDSSPDNDLRDVNQLLLSATISKSMNKLSHSLSTYYGIEDSVKSEGEYNAQEFYGIAFTEQFLLPQGHVPYARLSLQRSENQAVAPAGLFGNEIRQDDTFSVTAGWHWQASKHITVSADVTYTDHQSNVVLYEYDRLKYQTGFRYQF